MIADEIISDLRSLGRAELFIVLNFLADRVYEAELETGEKIRDASDCKRWLEELAEEAKR